MMKEKKKNDNMPGVATAWSGADIPPKGIVFPAHPAIKEDRPPKTLKKGGQATFLPGGDIAFQALAQRCKTILY